MNVRQVFMLIKVGKKQNKINLKVNNLCKTFVKLFIIYLPTTKGVGALAMKN